ncbi:hypothetical protein PGB90_001501 [Kerria lacca]
MPRAETPSTASGSGPSTMLYQIVSISPSLYKVRRIITIRLAQSRWNASRRCFVRDPVIALLTSIST